MKNENEIERIRVNVQGDREGDATSWNLPAWGHPLSTGIMPFCAVVEGHLMPIGTAFSIGPYPTLIFSAAHNIYEGLNYEPNGDRFREDRKLLRDHKLSKVAFAVLQQRAREDGNIEIWVRPVDELKIGEETDLVIGQVRAANFSDFREMALPITLDLPRINSKVKCFGYCDFTFPKDGIPLDAVRERTFDWQNEYSHRFHVVEGTVKNLFLKQFDRGMVTFPCFSIDAEIKHAQSGGPVITQNGHICGINSSSGGYFLDPPASLISLLAPIFNIKINDSERFIDLITSGKIMTDGSEERRCFKIDENGRYEHIALIHEDDWKSTHDNFDGYQNQREPTPESELFVYMEDPEKKRSE